MPVLTLDGNIQQISIAQGRRKRIRWLSFTPGVANAEPVYITTDPTDAVLDETTFELYIPAAEGGVPSAPSIIAEFDDLAISPQLFYVRGESGGKLHICMLFENSGQPI